MLEENFLVCHVLQRMTVKTSNGTSSGLLNRDPEFSEFSGSVEALLILPAFVKPHGANTLLYTCYDNPRS